MTELTLCYSQLRQSIVIKYRNDPLERWKLLLTVTPLEAIELSRWLEQAVSFRQVAAATDDDC